MFLKQKRCVLTLGRIKYIPKPVYIKGEAVERVKTYKYLGVVFDSELKWKKPSKSKLENVLLEKAEIFWSQFRYVSNFL